MEFQQNNIAVKQKLVDSARAIVVADQREYRLASLNTDQFRDGNVDFIWCLVHPSVK